jgi:hypothetical protein
MFIKNVSFALGLTALAWACAGCSHAETALSPIVGTWKINGDTPAPSANLPQFTTLAFKSDGSLEASYVAATGALGHIVNSSPQIKHEHDTYTIKNSSVHIIEGSRALDYAYEIHDDRLLLTPTNDDTAVVYVRVASP